MRRRGLLTGMIAIAALAAGAAWKFRLFAKHYPPTPYDDLLSQITDREPAIMFGSAARKSLPSAARLAAELRRDGRILSARAEIEPKENRVTEVAGWIVPQSVALYAALAAQI